MVYISTDDYICCFCKNIGCNSKMVTVIEIIMIVFAVVCNEDSSASGNHCMVKVVVLWM